MQHMSIYYSLAYITPTQQHIGDTSLHAFSMFCRNKSSPNSFGKSVSLPLTAENALVCLSQFQLPTKL